MPWLDSFNWMHALITLVSAGPSNLIFAYALAEVFPPKSVRVYWGLQVVLLTIAVATKQYWSVELTMVVGTVTLIVVPLVCLVGPLFAKAVVAVVALVVQFSAEVPVAFLWIAVVGQPVMDNDAIASHFLEYLAVVIVFHIVLLTVLFWAFVKACRRFVPRTASGEGASRFQAFIIFPCVQFCLLLLVMYVAFVSVGDDESYLIALFFLFGVCLLVDALLFAQMQRYADKRFSDLSAALLQEQADGYLAAAQRMQQSLAEAAVLRHDLRNHMQVVEGLCERGEREEAQAYLGKAAHLLR